MIGNKISRITVLKALLALQAVLFSLRAQNLVSNGNFENHTNCSNPYVNNAINWYAASLTPDYFSSCWPSSSGSNLPYASKGYQQDCCGGGAYVGGIMFDKSHPDYGKEYIYAKLIDTLQAGHRYLASMYVSRGEAVDYAITTMGMLFTDTAVVLSSQGFILASPQVKSTTLLVDTTNWMLVQDTIVAIGNEAYLTMGNFNTDGTSDTVKLTNYWPSFPIAYYYIDNVSVYDIATLGVNNIDGKEAEISVYPNPTNSYLKINCNLQHAVCSLQDVLGNNIKTQELKNKEEIIDISDFSQGIYFLNVKSAEGVLSKKIIVQH